MAEKDPQPALGNAEKRDIVVFVVLCVLVLLHQIVVMKGYLVDSNMMLAVAGSAYGVCLFRNGPAVATEARKRFVIAALSVCVFIGILWSWWPLVFLGLLFAIAEYRYQRPPSAALALLATCLFVMALTTRGPR